MLRGVARRDPDRQPPTDMRCAVSIDTINRRTEVEVHPVTPRIGAEIRGVDLNHVSDGHLAGIRQALLDHRVVFFRGQDLDADGHVTFASRLGPLTRSHPTLPPRTKDAAIFDLDSLAGASANHWHTDVTFVEQPPTFSVLRSVIIPEVGGDTLWANTVAAYRDLRPDLRLLADGLRAVHTNGQDYGRVDVAALRGKLSPEQLEYLTNFISTVFETEHPVVRVHPETGEPALLLGGFAHRLVGHPTNESVDLLRTLQSYVTRPENTVRWRWQEGDVVIWDNRSTQHYAVADYAPQRRQVQRVTTAGVAAVGLDGTTSVSLEGDATDYYHAA
jgi:alpha-ketoglutarate-dependent sulfate ester dioxygenase